MCHSEPCLYLKTIRYISKIFSRFKEILLMNEKINIHYDILIVIKVVFLIFIQAIIDFLIFECNLNQNTSNITHHITSLMQLPS